LNCQAEKTSGRRFKTIAPAKEHWECLELVEWAAEHSPFLAADAQEGGGWPDPIWQKAESTAVQAGGIWVSVGTAI